MTKDSRLSALRGATCCRNDAGDLEARIPALYDELLLRNGLAEEDIVSLIFTATKDLTALNPAAALRRSGRAADLALFSAQESDAEGSLPGVIRVLVHCYLESGRKPVHAYLNGAEALRPDRGKKST